MEKLDLIVTRDIDLTSVAEGRALLIALGIGLMIGTERGWSERGELPGARVAGLRTFGLLALAGGLAAVLDRHGATLVGTVGVLGAAAALLAGYVRDMARVPSVSATTTIAGMVTMGLGTLAASGLASLAAGIAVVMILLLSLRGPLHGWLTTLSEADLRGSVRFALIALVVLPLLPDRNYGPYGAWNPHSIWLVVVFVSGLSMAGYFAVRRLGAATGTLALAAVGATVSSTAVTASLSRQLRDPDSPQRLIAAAISVASAVMYVRALALTAVLVPVALPTLATVLGPAALVSVGLSFWAARRSTGAKSAGATPVNNPFDLRPALAMAAIVAAMSLAVRWAVVRYGDAGITTVLAITGSMDVDSAIITMHGLPAGTVAGTVAGLILALPILLNMAFKTGITVVLGGWTRGLPAGLLLLASMVAALVPLAVLWFDWPVGS